MAKGVVDLFLIYQFIKRLVTPFNKWDAYKAGVIDQDGKVILPKKDRTPEQNKSWGYYDIMIANLKKLLAKVPGGRTRLASYAAALLLLREQDERFLNDASYLYEELEKEMKMLRENSSKDFSDLRTMMEDAPANATGAAVAGTGDDPVHWSNRHLRLGPKGNKKKMGRQISGVSYLKRRMKRTANNVTKVV